VDNTDNATGKFRIIVRPEAKDNWPAGSFLRQGVRAHAWIFLNQVSLAYELWRRFNDFPPDLPHNASQFTDKAKYKEKKDSK
jgi:membrane fusion protein, adhesin transport system